MVKLLIYIIDLKKTSTIMETPLIRRRNEFLKDGVNDHSNRMGIPTVFCAIKYEEWNGNRNSYFISIPFCPIKWGLIVRFFGAFELKESGVRYAFGQRCMQKYMPFYVAPLSWVQKTNEMLYIFQWYCLFLS